MKPLISIIIPTFNMDKTIIRAIKSCLNQTYKNIEIIVIDDNSLDHTYSILKPLIKSKKIKYYKLSKNNGCSYCRNYGIKKSKGNYICFLDADDTLPKESIHNRTNFLLNNNSSIVCGSTNYVNNNSSIKYKRLINLKILNNTNKQFIANQFLNTKSIPFITASLMYKKNIFSKIDYFDTSKKVLRSQDADFTYRVLKKYKPGYILKPVYNYYKGSKPKHKRIGYFYSQFKGKIHVISKHKKGFNKYYYILTNTLQFPLKLLHQILFF